MVTIKPPLTLRITRIDGGLLLLTSPSHPTLFVAGAGLEEVLTAVPAVIAALNELNSDVADDVDPEKNTSGLSIVVPESDLLQQVLNRSSAAITKIKVMRAADRQHLQTLQKLQRMRRKFREDAVAAVRSVAVSQKGSGTFPPFPSRTRDTGPSCPREGCPHYPASQQAPEQGQERGT